MSPPSIPVAALIGIEASRLGAPLVGRADTRGLLPQVVPGQVLSARVDAVLPDGNFRVTVAGQPLSMALPKYFAPGDTLELVFVAREPRLTFTLSETPQTAPASVVSSAGRLVTSVLPRPGEAAMPAPAANAAPLLTAIPEDGAVLSTKLQGTLTQSGLFYESHQAEWVSGKRELGLLLLEPQARLGPQGGFGSQDAIGPQGRGDPQARIGAGLQEATGPQSRVDPQARTGPQERAVPQGRVDPQARPTAPGQPQAAQAPQTAWSPAAQNPAMGIAPGNDFTSLTAAVRGEQALPQQVQTLVQQQLAALETGKMVFQLQVWPEQWMRWEIDEEAQHTSAQAADGEAQQSYQTRLHLDLPRLGGLDATLSFDAAGMRVRLHADQASSAAVLQDNRASLRAALADAGLPSVDIAVARHGQS
jgi:hypothetical protein